jgi:feruloyl esterase
MPLRIAREIQMFQVNARVYSLFNHDQFRGIELSATKWRRIAIMVSLTLGVQSAVVASPSSSDGAKEISAVCDSLLMTNFRGIEDAATQIISVEVVTSTNGLPEQCVVDGYVAPNVGFRLRLPGKSNWNGKFAQMAPGGYGGELGRMAEWCDDALTRGYACITQDTGHTGATYDATWAYNNLQAEFDYGVRAAHVATLAGKAITEHFYGIAPQYSYFMGCSGGGKQALVQAQRFPWNYDGIIAVEPSNPTITGVVQLWNAIATHDTDGESIFQAVDLELLHDAAITKCDLLDGLEDGIIGGDPRRCEFDPAILTCKAGQSTGCLSEAQVIAVKKVYGGAETSTGQKLYFPALPGGEKGVFFTGGRNGLEYKSMWWQYMGLYPDPGPNWEATDFDFDHDYKRGYMMDAVLVASDNPDLRKLQAEGHKLMIIQGWEDSGLPGPLVSLDYYEMVEKLMGGREATQESVRLFMIPGRSHCGGGVGAAAIDALGAMEQWVEQGQAPDMIVGAHVDSESRRDFLHLPLNMSSAQFTRPHFPYPLQARYKGTGDTSDYRNFMAVEPDAK